MVATNTFSSASVNWNYWIITRPGLTWNLATNTQAVLTKPLTNQSAMSLNIHRTCPQLSSSPISSILEDLEFTDDLVLLSPTQSCLLSTLLCGSKCWRMTKSHLHLSWQNSILKNLRRILHIFWPKTISNQQLFERCNQESMESMETIIMGRWWRWIGHINQRDQDNITNIALHWTHGGQMMPWITAGEPFTDWHRTERSQAWVSECQSV